jgi:hypothetical protein
LVFLTRVAFLYHLRAFTLVAAVAIELVLIRCELTPSSARRLQVTDLVLGIAAGASLVVGLSDARDRRPETAACDRRHPHRASRHRHHRAVRRDHGARRMGLGAGVGNVGVRET